MANQPLRQAPPPPPHAPLPEDFQDLHSPHNGTNGTSKNSPSRQLSHHLPPSEQILQARKKEMQDDLDKQLKQLDSERKEGLYRLDWELAEAIEALHAKHADRANKMIHQHKETINLMEKRAQAGEELTPESLQRMRPPPAQAPAPVRAPQPMHHQEYVEESEYSEETASESEEESEEEGIFSQIVSMIRGDDPEPPVRRAPRVRQYSQEDPPPLWPVRVPSTSQNQQHFDTGQQADFWPNGSPQRGAVGSPETDGFGMTASNSPLAMPPSNLSFMTELSPTPEISGSSLPDFPFATGSNLFANGQQNSPSGLNIPELYPRDLPRAESSPTANLFRNSFGPLPGGQLGSPGSRWPPANVFHGGGY